MRPSRRALAGVDDLELGTLNWVWWFNEVRLHGEIGNIPQSNVKTPTTIKSTPKRTHEWENPASAKLGGASKFETKYNNKQIPWVRSASGWTE